MTYNNVGNRLAWSAGLSVGRPLALARSLAHTHAPVPLRVFVVFSVQFPLDRSSEQLLRLKLKKKHEGPMSVRKMRFLSMIDFVNDDQREIRRIPELHGAF